MEEALDEGADNEVQNEGNEQKPKKKKKNKKKQQLQPQPKNVPEGGEDANGMKKSEDNSGESEETGYESEDGKGRK